MLLQLKEVYQDAERALSWRVCALHLQTHMDLKSLTYCWSGFSVTKSKIEDRNPLDLHDTLTFPKSVGFIPHVQDFRPVQLHSKVAFNFLMLKLLTSLFF